MVKDSFFGAMDNIIKDNEKWKEKWQWILEIY